MGKPTSINLLVLSTRIHSVLEGTWGTETSKYPQEKKVI